MDHHEKKKMAFVPIVRQHSLQDDEDLLHREMSEIFRSSSESPTRTIPSLKVLAKAHQSDLPEESENDDSDDNKDTSEASRPSEIVLDPTKLSTQELAIRPGMKYFPKDFRDNFFPEGRRKKRNENSQSSFWGSGISINVTDESDLKFDRTPHDLFVQLNELHDSGLYQEWHETSRWIKYEENVEEGADRWGQAHISPLSFHSLLNVRRCLESGVVMLDVEEKDFQHIVFRAVKKMFTKGIIRFEDQENIFKTVLMHHDYDNTFSFGLKRGLDSNPSIKSHDERSRLSISRKNSLKKFRRRGSSTVYHPGSMTSLVLSKDEDKLQEKFPKGLKLQDIKTDLGEMIQNEYIMNCLPSNCEGAAVMTGTVDFLEQPTIAFIRLAEGVKIPFILEVLIPVRFLFILLGPQWQDINYHEVGRAISTLLNNKNFHNEAYKAKSRRDLMAAMNEFLDESLVIPPGKLDKEDLLPFVEMKEKADMIRMRKRKATEVLSSQNQIPLNQSQLKFLSDKFEAGRKKPKDPLRRTGKLWGGLINDVKRRIPMYKSDIVDGLNFETFAAIVFLYFACFATAITFGGLESDLTKGAIGISETILSCSIVGIIFHLLCGQPLVIVGTTGPLILFDKALLGFCESQGFEFLNVRFYVGCWLIFIGLIVSAFEGSTFVKHFSRFTQEIFSALITLIYIYSTINKTVSVYAKNPLIKLDDYNPPMNSSEVEVKRIENQPNTALFCTLLTLGTFTFAYTFKLVKTSKFLGKTTRKFLGDFCVPISIAIFVVIANVVSQVETEKLSVPDGIKPSTNRDWIVPLWKQENPIWLPVISVVPALLVYILAFMESHISELIVDKAERKLKKGSGLHLDIVLLCFLNALCGLFGCPWHCAAAVRSVAHVTAVTVMSTNHAPGESAHIVGVKEQRVSGFVVSLLIGLSIFAAKLLQKIPISVLFGVFLYMGICSMIGVQLFERIVLFFVPVKYHPHVPYATQVLTSKMHIFTAIQVLSLTVLWIVNESVISLSFPFFLILMVPLRSLLGRFYTPAELQALDGVPPKIDEDDAVDLENEIKPLSNLERNKISANFIESYTKKADVE